MLHSFSVRRLFPALLFVSLFALAAREVFDPDFWWHLRVGEYVVQHHAVPNVDLYSSVAPGQPWVAHEWGTEVLIYVLYRSMGWGGLICVFSLMVTAAFGFVYARSPGKPYVAGIAAGFGALASAITWGVRTQMVTLLFGSIALYLLGGFAVKGGRRVWLMVPLMILWANLHAGFFVGLVLVAVFGVGVAADALAGFETWPEARPRVLTLAQLLCACMLAVMVNPRGPKLVAFFGAGILSMPFSSANSLALQTYVPEWQSPDFHNSALQPFLWLLLLTFLVMILSRKRVRPSALLLLLPSAWAGLHSVRHLSIFALIAAPLLAEHLEALISERSWAHVFTGGGAAHVPTRTALLNLAILLVALFATGMRIAGVVRNQPQWERVEYPAAAVEYLKAQHLPGPLYHPYEWGGYLIWRAYPEYRVFIDGRSEIYGQQFLEDFFKAQRARADARRLMDRYGVKTALAYRSDATSLLLQNDPDWQKVFEDGQSVIFTRRGIVGPRLASENGRKPGAP